MAFCERAVVFVTDPDFLVPTLVAAAQVEEQVASDRLADVLVVLVGFDAAQTAVAAEVIAALGLQRHSLDGVHLPDSVTFNATHVPVASLARLLLPAILPERYEHIVYLDGDVQIVGDIRPLIQLDVPAGSIAAANDKYWLGSFGRRRFQMTYLGGLGIDDPWTYFNCGVLAFRRATWAEMAPAAYRFFLDHSVQCRFHDQSALNAVFKGRRQLLSPAYNYISDYVLLGEADLDTVKILHFTGGLKPWYYFGTPWLDRFRSSYEAMFARFPQLSRFRVSKTPAEQQEMERAHRRRLFMLKVVFPLVTVFRRLRLNRYLKQAQFDLR